MSVMVPERRCPPRSATSRYPEPVEPGDSTTARPVDDRRLARLHMGAAAILANPGAHTPLELRWAAEVRDLTVALAEARGAAAERAAPEERS